MCVSPAFFAYSTEDACVSIEDVVHLWAYHTLLASRARAWRAYYSDTIALSFSSLFGCGVGCVGVGLMVYSTMYVAVFYKDG